MSFMRNVSCILVAMVMAMAARASAAVEVSEQGGAATIQNDLVCVSYDLAKGTYNIVDKKNNRPLISSACSKYNQWASNAAGVTHTAAPEPLSDALGMGRSLLISSAVPGGPTMLLRISLYDDAGFVALSAGLVNGTDKVIQLKDFSPLCDATAFAGEDAQVDYATLDGSGGGNKTYVERSPRKRASHNNLLATFGGKGSKRSIVLGGLTYSEFDKYAAAELRGKSLVVDTSASDPVGKRIDPGTRYLPDDRFYLDALTDNPFDALEIYANRVRLAQRVVLNVCRFPIVDTWFAQVPHFGGGEDRNGYRARNDSVGAVEEMECIARSGFLKYAPVAVLIEPDLYDPNNQQGWWDDEHWQRGPGNRAHNTGAWVSSHGQFVKPYDTARKWAGAIKALGGIPMIYIQTGFRSQDYAERFPGHMLFNKPDEPHLNEKGEQLYRDKEKKQPRKLGYDYTDPGFINHVREVWENLRLAGVQGVKFDYPDYPFTGWPTRGGMEDAYATTAMHYRNIYRLAREGLGPDCYLHERTLDRGSDLTAGLTTSQRTEGDTDKMDPTMVSRVGLRWYKNRVIMNYDMDGKNPFHASPDNRDGQRAIWTMAYTASGTLMLSPSFGRLTAEHIRDLSRIYPFHSQRQSARPVDAFSSKLPRIFDYRVDAQWHQLTFYNTDAAAEATIGVDLAGDTAFGAIGLDPQREYYIYDFWNARLIGKVPAAKRFEQTLRPGEARMMSVHEAADHPQFISTDRHIMQGYVDLLGCEWDSAKNQLRGVSAVIGQEPYKVIIATNGYRATAANVDDSIAQSVAKSRLGPGAGAGKASVKPVEGSPGLVELTLERADNGPVAWTVTFEKQ